MAHIKLYSCFAYYKRWFSIAMWNCKRVPSIFPRHIPFEMGRLHQRSNQRSVWLRFGQRDHVRKLHVWQSAGFKAMKPLLRIEWGYPLVMTNIAIEICYSCWLWPLIISRDFPCIPEGIVGAPHFCWTKVGSCRHGRSDVDCWPLLLCQVKKIRN